ncbi:MAG: SCP2 sterol-binding domain-containing protein [Acidimicrobiales bacterium]
MGKHPFLSPEWTKAARAVHADFAARTEPAAMSVRMNLVVTEVPFCGEAMDAHLDTSSGRLELDTGHLEDPDLTVTIDYETAKAVLIEQNSQAGMQAFMAGRIKVEGDLSKLLALQAGPIDPAQNELAARVREITE